MAHVPNIDEKIRAAIRSDPLIEWSANIWMGVSVESDEYQSRIDRFE